MSETEPEYPRILDVTPEKDGRMGSFLIDEHITSGDVQATLEYYLPDDQSRHVIITEILEYAVNDWHLLDGYTYSFEIPWQLTDHITFGDVMRFDTPTMDEIKEALDELTDLLDDPTYEPASHYWNIVASLIDCGKLVDTIVTLPLQNELESATTDDIARALTEELGKSD